MHSLVYSTTLSPAMYSQEFRGAISGVVTDATGGRHRRGQSHRHRDPHRHQNPDCVRIHRPVRGPFLQPGDYDIAAKIAGFKEFVRKDVHVGAGDHPVIDIRLEVGDATQSVEVTADAPLINTENASTGRPSPPRKWRNCR